MSKENKPLELVEKKGVLLLNLGTPSAPTAAAVRQFLAPFLSDQRVVALSPLFWLPLLYGVILPTRAPRVAKLYEKIWQPDGSPLLVYSKQLQNALQEKLMLPVELAMTYGEPSCINALDLLKAQGCSQIVVLPLYPQYSSTTTAAAFDAVAAALKKQHELPALRFVTHYFSSKPYIEALTDSVLKLWQEQGEPQQLICSYHGIPQLLVDQGDPYYAHCLQTSALLQEALLAHGHKVPVESCFQSRFGRQQWLEPYTEPHLISIAQQGVKRVDLIAPSFACDCLETLEELAVEAKEAFLQAGGEELRYIPCLNAAPLHLEALYTVVHQQLQGW
ncbi:MAG: ferrochelatase [Vibrionaceae bacterium]